MSKYSDRKFDNSNKNDSLTIIYDWIEPDSKVLDIGCDEGYLGKALIHDKNSEMYGLEVNRKAAAKAAKFFKKVWVSDLDNENPFREINQKFDFIVIADVLEHTKYPGRILEKIKNLLDKNGKVLISIPNIAHFSARLELLNGSFEYERLGIFDETHLKYFTRESFKRLLLKTGFKVEMTKGVLRDIPKEIISKLLSKVGLKITKKFLKEGEKFESQAYQLVYKISKADKKYKNTEDNIFKFKPMTLADDSVYFLRDKVKELSEEIVKYKKQLHK